MTQSHSASEMLGTTLDVQTFPLTSEVLEQQMAAPALKLKVVIWIRSKSVILVPLYSHFDSELTGFW